MCRAGKESCCVPVARALHRPKRRECPLRLHKGAFAPIRRTGENVNALPLGSAPVSAQVLPCR